MTVPIGRLEAQIDADFGGLSSALLSLERGLDSARKSIQKTGTALSGLESFSNTFESTLRSLQQVVVQTSGPIDDLERRTAELTQAWRAGIIGENEYALGLRQLKVDIAGTAAATSRSAAEMERLASIGGQVTGQLRAVTAHARRGAQGFEAFGVTTNAAAMLATGGIRGISSAAMSLSVFSLGNPAMIGILSGIAALASAWSMVSSRTDEATVSAQSFQRINLAGITGGAFARWMTAADAAFAARGTDDFSRLNATAQMYGRRYDDAVARVNDLLRRGVHQQSGVGGGGVTGGGMGAAPRGVGVPDLGYLDNALPVPTDLPGFKAFENSFEGATARMAEMKESMGKELEGMKSRFASIDVFGALGNGLVQISGIVGEAIAGVGGGFRSIGKVILQVLGGLMKSVGASMIMFGFAGQRIQTFITNPAGAIAAGIALVALGSALSASVSRQVSSAGGGGGGSGLVSAPSSAGLTGEGRGNVTIVFPSGSVINPADPRQQDLILQMIEAAQGRNVQIRVGGA